MDVGSTIETDLLDPELAPVDGDPADDSAAGRLAHGWPAARVLTRPRTRRLLGVELLVVLAMFLLQAGVEAVLALIRQAQGTASSYGYLPQVDGWGFEVVFTVLAGVIVASPAALVWYLLVRNGEGPAAIGLDWWRWRTDLALMFLTFSCVFLLPQLGGGLVVRVLHLHGYTLGASSGHQARWLQTFGLIVGGTASGIVEEVVVLGYLVRRLEQRGWATWAVVAVAFASRASYHLYYGWNILPIACWALVSILVYRRTRRLWPFIWCHIIWDLTVSLGHSYASWAAVIVLSCSVATFTVMFVFWRWTPRAAGHRPLGVPTTVPPAPPRLPPPPR